MSSQAHKPFRRASTTHISVRRTTKRADNNNRPLRTAAGDRGEEERLFWVLPTTGAVGPDGADRLTKSEHTPPWDTQRVSQHNLRTEGHEVGTCELLNGSFNRADQLRELALER